MEIFPFGYVDTLALFGGALLVAVVGAATLIYLGLAGTRRK